MTRTTERLDRLTGSVDSWLYGRGFRNIDVIRLVRTQMLLAGLSSLGILVGTLLSGWSLAYAAGALIVTANFYSLAKFVQGVVNVSRGAVPALLVRFYGRLIGTGLILFGLIVWADASVVGLLAGLSTVVVSAVYFGATRYLAHF